jgi:hypothetical protein
METNIEYQVIYHHNFYGTCREGGDDTPFPTLKMAEIFAKGLVEEYKSDLIWWKINKITTEEVCGYDKRNY